MLTPSHLSYKDSPFCAAVGEKWILFMNADFNAVLLLNRLSVNWPQLDKDFTFAKCNLCKRALNNINCLLTCKYFGPFTPVIQGQPILCSCPSKAKLDYARGFQCCVASKPPFLKFCLPVDNTTRQSLLLLIDATSRHCSSARVLAALAPRLCP